MRKRITYANVAATMALVFSMSGGALAANHYLISSAKQISPKVLKKLKGKTGPAGPQGKEGSVGKEGPAGPAGPATEAKIPAPTWHNLTLEDGWTAIEGTYAATPRYTIDPSGFVHLSGTIDGESISSAQIATLPAGFRPTTAHAWENVSETNGDYDPHGAALDIESDGAIVIYAKETSANFGFVSLEGVTFYAG